MLQKPTPSTFQSRRAAHLDTANGSFELDSVSRGSCEGNIKGDRLTLEASRRGVCLFILLKYAGDLVSMLLQDKNSPRGLGV